jgi:predicted RNase H-like nuclease (RuvC/YqgF family)
VPEDRYESLTRINDELSRKLVDAERTLASKLEASDQELAELEGRLEEMRQELAQKNREEKELRAKDVSIASRSIKPFLLTAAKMTESERRTDSSIGRRSF